jgi:hypothetical protein
MVSVLRPAVRVVCLDERQRLLLLLRWRDPADGSYLWSPLVAASSRANGRSTQPDASSRRRPACPAAASSTAA